MISVRMSEQSAPPPESRRRERALVLAAVAALVIWRSSVLVFWEQAQFDSDQAVIGLMAKHLSEGRAFPVFMYGQSYILGVQAWMAAPMFLLFGVSVAALKLPLLIINLAIAILLVRRLEAEIGLRPALAGLATAPFILPAPGTSAHLLEPTGGNLETFLYVLLIWLTRHRPWLCGVIFGVGFLQREFALYGLAALGCVMAVQGLLATREGWIRIGKLVASAAAVWIAVQGLRRLSSAAGPGTSIADLAGAPNNLLELASRTCVAPATLALGTERLFSMHWPQLLGTAPYPLSDFAIESAVTQGLAWASVLPAAAAIIAVIGIVSADRASNWRVARSIAGYLLLVGLFSVAGYVVGRCGELSFYTMRYELLSLAGFIALGAWFLSVARWRRLVPIWGAIVVTWTLLAASSHARLWKEYVTAPPVAAKQMVLRTLQAEGVEYGWADYWMAYYITFLSREQIIMGSTDFVRIRPYQTLVEQHAGEAVKISRTACPGGREIIRNVYRCP